MAAVLKTTFGLMKPNIKYYGDCIKLCNDSVRKNLLSNIFLGINTRNSYGLETFLGICINALDKLWPGK